MKKKTFLIPLSILSLGLVACGGEDKPTPTPTPTIFSVSLEGSEVLSLSNLEAKEGEEYNADISVLEQYQKYCSVTEDGDKLIVTSNGAVLKSGEGFIYTYNTKSSAHITIPSNFVKGNVLIETKAEGDEVNVSSTSKDILIETGTNRTVIGSDYSTEVYLSDDASKSGKSLDEKIKNDSIKVKDKNGVEYPIGELCTYKRVSEEKAELYIPASKANDTQDILITGDVSIDIPAIEQKYSVSYNFDDYSHLKKSSSSPTDAIKHQDFSFDIEVANDSNEEKQYFIPDELEILVGDDIYPLAPSAYSIVEETENNDEKFFTKAKVTIFGDNVDGEIKISGQAKEGNVYRVDVIKNGVNFAGDKVVAIGSDYNAIIRKEADHDMPEDENVRVYVGDPEKSTVDDWLIPNASPGVTIEPYGENAKKLTIDSSIINNPIKIALCAPDVSLLKECSWDKISYYSEYGYAPYLFEVGEVTNAFTLEGYEQPFTARILDFNRDGTSKVKTVGITFEFVECIDYLPFNTTEKSTYYYNSSSVFTSNIYDYLNNTIYNKLPFKQHVKQVTKITLGGSEAGSSYSSTTRSSNYLFPLSLAELDVIPDRTGITYKGELPINTPTSGPDTNKGYTYYYGKSKSIPNYLRKTLNGEEADYWSRTPFCDQTSKRVFRFSNYDEKFGHILPTTEKIAVSPAFCI